MRLHVNKPPAEDTILVCRGTERWNLVLRQFPYPIQYNDSKVYRADLLAFLIPILKRYFLEIIVPPRNFELQLEFIYYEYRSNDKLVLEECSLISDTFLKVIQMQGIVNTTTMPTGIYNRMVNIENEKDSRIEIKLHFVPVGGYILPRIAIDTPIDIPTHTRNEEKHTGND